MSTARSCRRIRSQAGTVLPSSGNVFISIRNEDKTDATLDAAKTLQSLGFGFLATRGTAAWLNAAGVETEQVNKVYEGGLTIVDRMKDGHVQLVWNTTEGIQAIEDSRDIRAIALYDKIPYYTTAAGSQASAQAIKAQAGDAVTVRALQA